MLLAPASPANSTIRRSVGESLMPGISGATTTPVGMPASAEFADRLQPLARVGVRGSVSATPSRRSLAPTVRGELRALDDLAKQSMSRISSGDFVRTEQGLARRRAAPARSPRISS